MTDEQLALLAQQGNSNAELELFNKYRSLINKCSRGYFLIGGDIEDLVQEGMIGLYKAIKNYSADKAATFSTFASLCIRRQIQSAVRNASAKKNKALSSAVPIMDEDSDDTGVYLIADGESPDSILIHRQTSQAIFEELKKLLSPLEYDVLKYYLSGLSYQQIASKTKQTKKSIDNALSRIKKKLAAIKEVI
ncbi:MAG TPA: RNA polymerase sporulation sigma factor SigH [Clostridiales bacterium]|nr:RNA polymerase sporulation sigma factor SigH [Clostridiales bacterium]